MKIMTLALGSCILLLASTGHATQGQRISRVSVGTGGTQASLASGSPAISGDGRFVAFQSDAPDLVPVDQNHAGDVFVRDRVGRTTTLVSVATSGAQGNGQSDAPSISGEGSFVAFMSHASNLVAGDQNGVADIFLRDLVNGTTERVSVDASGQEANGLSAGPYVSTAGRYVSFISYATNLVPGDSNGQIDVFVRNQITGAVTRASVDSQGMEGNQGGEDASLSYDGRYVVFSSRSDNLVPGDTNGFYDTFVHDLLTGTTTRVNVATDGTQANSGSDYPTISATGQFIVFGTPASNLVPGDTNGTYDVFLHDLIHRTTKMVDFSSSGVQANAYTSRGTVSSDGRYVAFKSTADNLVPHDVNSAQDVFVRDMLREVTVCLSANVLGRLGNDHSSYAVISADGRNVAFYSAASNLVPGDTNGDLDVFVSSYAIP